jgi:hypothetical protein
MNRCVCTSTWRTFPVFLVTQESMRNLCVLMYRDSLNILVYGRCMGNLAHYVSQTQDESKINSCKSYGKWHCWWRHKRLDRNLHVDTFPEFIWLLTMQQYARCLEHQKPTVWQIGKHHLVMQQEVLGRDDFRWHVIYIKSQDDQLKHSNNIVTCRRVAKRQFCERLDCEKVSRGHVTSAFPPVRL